jgi:hypothetical protein
MSPLDQWVRAFARQADADFKAWQLLQDEAEIPECHRLLFLQMACEKLCKAQLIGSGTPPETLQASHGYVAGPLPMILRQQILLQRRNRKRMAALLSHIRHLANEIEVLNPAVRRDGQRPDNCEYPWENGQGVLHSPLDWTFSPSRLLTALAGRTFVKLVSQAIRHLL